VDAFPLIHAKTQNLAYRIALRNTIVTHIGDAEVNEANFKTLASKGPVDVAMVPFWWLLDPQSVAFLRDTWKPRQVVAFHFGAADATQAAPKLRKSSPEAWLCTRAGESRTF
jgi:L-ascorbate metabolism protein UlaG (beta-lactamase superfamily)